MEAPASRSTVLLPMETLIWKVRVYIWIERSSYSNCHIHMVATYMWDFLSPEPVVWKVAGSKWSRPVQRSTEASLHPIRGQVCVMSDLRATFQILLAPETQVSGAEWAEFFWGGLCVHVLPAGCIWRYSAGCNVQSSVKRLLVWNTLLI